MFWLACFTTVLTWFALYVVKGYEMRRNPTASVGEPSASLHASNTDDES